MLSVRSPPDVLLSFLQQPFAELKGAAFHACSALALRPWFAADLVRCGALLERVLDPGSETGQVAADWRFAVVNALRSTIQVMAVRKCGWGTAVQVCLNS